MEVMDQEKKTFLAHEKLFQILKEIREHEMEIPLEERRVLLERLEAEEREFEGKRKQRVDLPRHVDPQELLKSFRKQNGCATALRSSPMTGDEILGLTHGSRSEFANTEDLSSKTGLCV